MHRNKRKPILQPPVATTLSPEPHVKQCLTTACASTLSVTIAVSGRLIGKRLTSLLCPMFIAASKQDPSRRRSRAIVRWSRAVALRSPTRVSKEAMIYKWSLDIPEQPCWRWKLSSPRIPSRLHLDTERCGVASAACESHRLRPSVSLRDGRMSMVRPGRSNRQSSCITDDHPLGFTTEAFA